MKNSSENSQLKPNPYWVTNCTYNINFKYSYENTKAKTRQTQSH